jgi:hypothetical protein
MSQNGKALATSKSNGLEHVVKYVLAILTIALVHSTVHAELMWVELQVIKNKEGGWKYSVKGEKGDLKSDAQLGKYLKKLSNPKDSIFLNIESEDDVPIEQLTKILGLVKANKQGIQIKKIVLDTKFANRPR